MTSVTQEMFRNDVESVEQAAEHGPVSIINRSEPRHVVLSYREFEEIGGKARAGVEPEASHTPLEKKPFRSLADLFAMPEGTPDELLDYGLTQPRKVEPRRELELF